MYYLQNRWKLCNSSLYYYGLRNSENMFRNKVRLSSAQIRIVKLLPKELSPREKTILKNLIGVQIVTSDKLVQTPASFAEARFCKKCCANDYIIPGLEFDADGLCPMCQTREKTKNFKSVLPIVKDIPRSKKSRFDVALFYTGGKDSAFLLYYLSKVKNLRVLALTWEIPFMSDNAKKSIENAKKIFDKTEFVTRSVSREVLKKIYSKLYSLSGNTCACPSLAYVLFYPEMVDNKIPYFVAGNEPVQMLGLYYNHIAPKIAYTFPDNKLLTALYNVGRIITLHPPLRQGQIQTLMTMKQLAYGDNPIKKLSGYTSELVSGVVKALHSVPEILAPLKRCIRRSSLTGNVPAFVHLDMDEIAGGKYDWKKIKDLLVRECGWVAPDEQNKTLHTSCKIEKCKDYSQFVNFYKCLSPMIPFSALEMSLASRDSNLSRDEVIKEMQNSLGFSLDEVPECQIMRDFTEGKK